MSFLSRFAHFHATCAQLVNVLQHDYADLHRHADQCQKSEARRHREVCAGRQQAEKSAERRQGDNRKNQAYRFPRTEGRDKVRTLATK